MVLNFGANFFGSSNFLENEFRHASVVVAKDGSGDTDDIQEGIDMLPKNGGLVFVKDGTYIITESISIKNRGVHLRGASWKSVISAGTLNDEIIRVETTAYDCVIENLQILGDITAGGSQIGIYFYGDQGLIQRCHIDDIGGQGIKMNSQEGRIFHNWIEDCTTYGIQNMDHNSYVCFNYTDDCNIGIWMDGAGDCTCSYNHVNSSTSHGIWVEDNSDLIFIGNQVSSNGGDGVFWDGDGRNIIMGNVINNSTTHGLNLDNADETVVVGNRINVNGDDGIWIQSDCNKALIHGNIVSRSTNEGIDDDTAGASTVSDNIDYNP